VRIRGDFHRGRWVLVVSDDDHGHGHDSPGHDDHGGHDHGGHGR
jgi:hypothetical protein